MSLKVNKPFTVSNPAVISLFLIVIVIIVYWPTHYNDFIRNYDDKQYILDNRHVVSGLTRENIIWAFTNSYAANWHPLTWISHMLDCHLFGLDPEAHHMTNLLFHVANTLLLFFAMKYMTGANLRSAFVAALFALHPLHVESVAWVSARKDLLSSFFWLLTMLAYTGYVKKSGLVLYLCTLVFFILGLMSKPMMVTLPFVLLLLDYWPFNRFDFKKGFFRLILEKIPFFLFSAISCVITFLAQKQGGAVVTMESVPVSMRFVNMGISYMKYMIKMIFPTNLAVQYPYPDYYPAWQRVGSFAILIFISMMIIRKAARFPWLVFGWLWFLGTLIPVIGLVQVGLQAMADRYTYLPFIGLFIIIGWGGAHLAEKTRVGKGLLALAAGFSILGLGLCTWFQVNHWKSGISLFEHALKSTINNYVAHNNLGIALSSQGKYQEAINHFSSALRIRPDYVIARHNLGHTLFMKGETDKAIPHFIQAIQQSPNYAEAYYNLGVSYEKVERKEDAIRCYERAVIINSNLWKARNNLGVLYSKKHDFSKAVKQFTEVIKLNPDNIKTYLNRAKNLLELEKDDLALADYSSILRIIPEDPAIRFRIGHIMEEYGRFKMASEFYSEAVRMDPGNKEYKKYLQNLIARRNDA